jgi:cell division transport system permease protein
MSRIFFLLGKSLGDIGRRPIAAFGALLSLLLLFLLFDIVWISSLSSRKYYDNLVSGIDIEVFIDDSLPDSSFMATQMAISKFEGVERVDLITKDDARTLLVDIMGVDLLNGLEGNPLPRSLVVTFRENFLNNRALGNYRKRMMEFEGVSQIFYAQHLLEKAENARMIISNIVIYLGGAILLAAVLNLVNSIRLSARAREFEITQLRLMGASRFFLLFPFILEGFLFSFLASMSGWILLQYGTDYFAFKGIEIMFPSIPEIVFFCLAASVTGIIGGYIGSRKIL